jgi:hypothetical protein
MQDFLAEVGCPGDPWPTYELHLDRLATYVPRLREHYQPRPYWAARHGRPRDEAATSQVAIQRCFAELVDDLRDRGYLQQALPKPCVEDQFRAHSDPSAVLAERLGIPNLWPLRPGWDQDTFFGLVEVFDDLVARPRERNFHDYDGCGWHYTAFTTETGRSLYRWKVNTLLEAGGVELRMADAGEDAGRLVHRVDDARTDLLARALATRDRAVPRS